MTGNPTPLLAAADVSVQMDDITLVDRASLNVYPNEVVVLLGPNGAGKTSLLRGLLGRLPTQADIYLQGDPITTLSPRERALRVSYLPQGRETAWPNRVFDIVALGRFAHGVSLGGLSDADADATRKAIAACQLEALQDRRINTLSGGELARVHCARLYAANTPLLIADEPTASLDPNQQHRVAQLFQSYANADRSVLMVLHDVNLAMRYATRLIWMTDASIAADIAPEEVSAELISEVYQVDTELVTTADGTKQFVMGLKK
ncbi:MAG: ABC transporter ATP-binding protein [Pseudomonadota bacterium]